MRHSNRNPQLGFAIAAGILAVLRIIIDGSTWQSASSEAPSAEPRSDIAFMLAAEAPSADTWNRGHAAGEVLTAGGTSLGWISGSEQYR